MVTRVKEKNKSKTGDREYWIGCHITGKVAKNHFN